MNSEYGNREFPRSLHTRSASGEGFGGYKVDFLNVTPGIEIDLTSLMENQELISDAKIDLQERYPDIVEEATRGLWETQGITLETWFKQKEKLLAVLGAGSRIINAMRLKMAIIPEFGMDYLIALESAKFADHGGPHSRMLEATTKMEHIVDPDLSDPNPKLVIATALFPWLHDPTQLMRRYYNELLPEHLRQDPRILHEEEAAFFIKCLTGLVAECGQMSYEDADEITTYLAIITLIHDKHGEIDNFMKGSEKAYIKSGNKYTPIDDANLFVLYTDRNLDLTSLSRRQWYVIFQKTREVQQKLYSSKIPDNPDSKYGCIPQIEKAFETEMFDAMQDDSPSMIKFSRQQRKALRETVYKNVVPDNIDMGYPADYAIPRKLFGPRGGFRLIGNPNTDLSQATNIKQSDHTGSDWARSMVEYWMMVAFLKRTKLWKNARFREIVGNTILLHAVRTDMILGDLMREYQYVDYKPVLSKTIHIIIDNRVQSVLLKAMVKHGGIPKDEQNTVIEEMKANENIDELSRMVIALLKKYTPQNKHNVNYAERLHRAIKKLHDIAKGASVNLGQKPIPEGARLDNGINRLMRYSNEDIAARDRNFQIFFKKLCRAIGIKNKNEIRILLKAFRVGEIQGIPCFVPQGTTSLGGIHDAKTFHDMTEVKLTIPDLFVDA